jgi:hypothetical protein
MWINPNGYFYQKIKPNIISHGYSFKTFNINNKIINYSDSTKLLNSFSWDGKKY